MMRVIPSMLDWDLSSFLENSNTTLMRWGALLMFLIGTIMLIWGFIQIAKGLITHGKGQTNWAIAILLVLVGGIFAGAGGWTFFSNIARGAKQTVDDLGHATNVPQIDDSYIPEG